MPVSKQGCQLCEFGIGNIRNKQVCKLYYLGKVATADGKKGMKTLKHRKNSLYTKIT